MVKTVKVASMGVPEIVKFSDLTGTGPGVPAVPGAASAAPNPLVMAKDAVNNIDQWINIADKGITLLGRVDSILSRVQTLQRPGQQQGPGPAQVPAGPLMTAPAGMVVNADPQYQAQQAAPAPAPAGDPAAIPVIVDGKPQMMTPEQMVSHNAKAHPVPVNVIVQALDTVEKLQPGISVAQLSESIKRNPVQVQHLLDAFAGSMK